ANGAGERHRFNNIHPQHFCRLIFLLAGKSVCKKARGERHFMSKRSCEAAGSSEAAILRMARVNGIVSTTFTRSISQTDFLRAGKL
ncbi:hypothetical protein, partial [Gallintestinimicrobium sp.]|uniref:hypothetical protein n=1 Tax=Gallintestinimicrobium sp. TaxID=2981655 RepID=UPI00307D8427